MALKANPLPVRRGGGSAAENLTSNLATGTYFVRVYQYFGDTNYNLTLTTLPANDNSTVTARDIGVLNATPRVVHDFVGNSDTQDYVRFAITQPCDVSLRLSGLSADADVQLLDSQGRSLADSSRSGSVAEEISRALDAGIYFVRVYQFSGDTNFDLSLSAVPNDNTLATARDLGPLGATPTSRQDFVGTTDTQDYYRFTITQTQNVSLRLSGDNYGANIQLMFPSGRVLSNSDSVGTAAWAIERQLEPGTYFVRAFQQYGEVSYDLTVSATAVTAGQNFPAVARNLGSLSTTPTTARDFVSPASPQTSQTYSRFTLTQTSDVSLRLSGLSNNADVELLDSQGRSLNGSSRLGLLAEEFRSALEAGTYYVRVYQVSGSPYFLGGTNYDLTLTATPNDNSLATARDLGAIGATPIIVHDFVGTPDTQDFYRFSIPQARNVSIREVGAGYGADVQLLNASGQVIANSTSVGTAIAGIDRLLEAGTYFVRAFQSYGEVNYDLTVSASVVVANDNSIAAARDLGALSSTPTTVRDFVGGSDTQDYFRFTLSQSRNVSLRLSGLSADADLQLLDAQGRVVASSIRGGTLSEDINLTLSAGTYFVRVVQYSGDTNYDLTLSAT